MRDGYRIPWASEHPPLSRHPIAFPPSSDPARYQVLAAEVKTLVEKRAIYLVQNPGPGFYSRLFTVPKKTGDWRPVLDLSSLNKFVERVKFKMETTRDVRLAIRRNDWATSIDLKDAYFHVTIHQEYRKYLRFVWEGRTYEFRALPFGLSLAPLIFTKVVLEFIALQRQAGHRLKVYLDDWALFAETEEQSHASTQAVLARAREFGFKIREDKCDLVPSQTFSYLGMRFDTVRFTVQPLPTRIQSLTKMILHVLRSPMVSRREFHRLLGLMESVSTLLPLARVYKRPLQRELAARFPPQPDWECKIPTGPWLRVALNQWLDDDWLHSSVPIRPVNPRVYLHSDASNMGWGAHFSGGEVSGTWTPQDQRQHINWLELKAIYLALQHFSSDLKDKSVIVCSDNTTALSYIRSQGGTVSPTLSLLAEELLIWAHQHGMSLEVEFIPGKLNVLADALSRTGQVLPTEWTIAHQALQPLWDLWGKPLVDLFATQYSARLPLYVSPIRDPMAWARNAFSIPWGGMSAYAYPPTALITRVLERYRLERPRLILVTPGWPRRPWYPELMSLTHVAPVLLRLTARTLVQPRTGIGHPNPDGLGLTAWLLCERGCAHRV